MSGFIGNIEARLDAKGRVFIPASYRKLLNLSENETVVMRKDPDSNSLVIYPENVWTAKLDELKATLDEWDPDDQALLRQYIYEAEILTVDVQGRVLISKKYLQQINADSEVLFVGGIDKFSIWSKEEFTKTILSPEDFAKRLREKMAKRKNNNL